MKCEPKNKNMTNHIDSTNHKQDDQEEAAVRALIASGSALLQHVINDVIQLDLFEIIAKAGEGAQISPSHIVSQIQTSNPEAAQALDSILRFLVVHSFLTFSTTPLENGVTERRYGLAPAGRFYVRNELGASLAPYHALGCQGGATADRYVLKEIVLNEGGTLSERINGKPCYEYMSKSDPKSFKILEDAMEAHSTIIMKRALEIYNGFKGLSSIVDVGGGNGTVLRMIISKYPSIHGINFDLPEVIKLAPAHNGIEHIGGDMFVAVPEGDVIMLKLILHNWNDDQCLKLLKNCHEKLTDKGKVIVMEVIFPEDPQTGIYSKLAAQSDIVMLINFGGKERTESEFEGLANRAGFAEFKVMCCAYGTWIMEFIK